MDLVDYDKEVYDKIVSDYQDFASRLNIPHIDFIPISALHGDNVVDKSDKLPWYKGSPLLYFLESVYINNNYNHIDARLPVQWVVRPQSDEYHDYRGYSGRVCGGVFKQGDEVVVLPSGFTSKVKSVHNFDGEIEEAFAPMSVTMTLEDEIDISRGMMIAKPNNKPHDSQDLEAMICWFSDSDNLQTRKKYTLIHTTNEVKCMVQEVRYKMDINTLRKIEDDKDIKLNDIGRIKIRSSSPVLYDSYRKNRLTGSFILVDDLTHNTVAAGMIL